MTRQYAQRKTSHKKYPSVSNSRPTSSQVNRSELEELINDPKSTDLTPDVVSQLQSTHGNQFVNDLVQQTPSPNDTNMNAYSQQFKMGGVSEISKTSQTSLNPVQRAPKSPEERKMDAYNNRQAGKPLVDAFTDATMSKGSVADIRWIFDPNFRLWRTSELENLSWHQFSKKQRIKSYDGVFDLLNGTSRGHHDDMRSLRAFAAEKYQTESLDFLIAVAMFRKDPTRERFFRIVDDYVAPGDMNLSYAERVALIERAERMRNQLIDENAQPIVDDIVDHFDPTLE